MVLKFFLIAIHTAEEEITVETDKPLSVIPTGTASCLHRDSGIVMSSP